MIRIYASLGNGTFDLDHDLEKLPATIKQKGALVWVLLDRPSADEIHRIGKIFGFHPLALEDCINVIELPKIDEFHDHAYIITHGLKINDQGEVEKVELDAFIGPNFLVTSNSSGSRSVALVKEKVERQPEQLARGMDFLYHSILDAQVDNYMPLVDFFDQEVDRLEETILEEGGGGGRDTLAEILRLRRQVVAIRRSIGPQRDVIGRLARHDLPFVTDKCSIYFRDVYDHVVRVHEMLEGIRDVVNGLMDSYRSIISQRLNEVMQKLTLISTIFLPMTFVASIYGMNFNPDVSKLNMPELNWFLGYPFALGIMTCVGLGFYLYFRAQKWV